MGRRQPYDCRKALSEADLRCRPLFLTPHMTPVCILLAVPRQC
ncbi:hypothetical protein CBM2615_A110009 [Cupriavidus taiwanensis]|uniref:Uncharacterized protein n=1 Tax=Cupriavidus taiwanensis TaxID=164546 RepID=A0A375DWH7_9BURK|nr:hypothetical protein CBM2614_A110009 [Cupriavidus taiwanensis]SOZ49047.1 hypothetical protein CBM2615_A110009 [Cupriavidus taiwanensis]SOZ51672.1 hypothetical protein CBM2613_A100009 [Cupriavidus taiwanensis]SPA07010.1 hypothetical protein CBM2625_A80009 [Cupriavidus taiwanensis]